MFCPKCGNQSAPDARFCSSCGGAFPRLGTGQRIRLVRPRHPRMLAGLCSGIAIHFGWDVALVRILFGVFACITSGLGVVLYVAGWLLIPDAPYALPARSMSGPGEMV